MSHRGHDDKAERDFEIAQEDRLPSNQYPSNRIDITKPWLPIPVTVLKLWGKEDYMLSDEEQLERIRILQDRICFLSSLPWNITASQSERFNQELYEWRQELRESIKSLERE